MSTKIGTLKGKIEIPINGKMKSSHKEIDIHLNSFYGGDTRGKSLQFSFLDEHGNGQHFQLDNNNVTKLVELIKENFR